MAGPSLYFGSWSIFDQISFRGVSVMTDERKKREPTPHLHTRPATMLTAIGLCVLIMLIQLVPQFQQGGSRPPAAAANIH
jgi:type II secretory pathway component PulF